jgi:hypothetical protein
MQLRIPGLFSGWPNGNGKRKPTKKRRNGNGRKNGGCADTSGNRPTPQAGEQVYCAQFMSKGKLSREFTRSRKTYRHAVVSAKTKNGSRVVRGWFETKAKALELADRLKKTQHEVGRVKARPAGERAPAKAPTSRKPTPTPKPKTTTKAAPKPKPPTKPATPAIKAKAKKEAAKLPTPVSVAELVNQDGDTFQVAELAATAQVLLTLRKGEKVKVTARGFPKGPMNVEAIEKSKSMLHLSLAPPRGGRKGKSYIATYHYPKRSKSGRLKQYVPFVLLARGRAGITKIVRYDPSEDPKKDKGLRPGAKDWDKASERARIQYFRNTLYQLAKETNDRKATDIRLRLILAVERPLEKSYVCEALKEYGKVPKVRRAKVGDIFYASWGYDQTNIDFYQIVGLTKKSAKVRKVAQRVASRVRGSDMVMPQKGNFLQPAKTKRLLYEWPSSTAREQRITPSITINSRTIGWFWDGKPVHQTASGYGH